MINYLSGKIIQKLTNEITLLVDHVGYQVFVPVRTASKLLIDKPAQFFIYTHVRETAFTLFGFTNPEDKNTFILLLNVSGVGPKTALSILSNSDSHQINQAIREANVDFFKSIPGIGKKSAQRIIVDLKQKLGDTKDLDLSQTDNPIIITAQQGLKSLGFSTSEAKTALVKILDKDKLSSSELIKQALKNLGK